MATGPEGISYRNFISFIPTKTDIKETVTKVKSLKPSKVPISSIKFSLPEDLLATIQQGVISLIMQLKALSIFTVKSLIISGELSNMQRGLTGIGGLFVGINVPAAAVNTFSLVRNWSSMDWKDRVLLSSSTLANYALSGAGISLLLGKAPAFSGLLSKGGALMATKVAFILGPIGMGVISLVSTAKGVLEAKKARQLSIQEEKAAHLAKLAEKGLGRRLLEREKARFAALKQFAISDSAKYLLIGIGIGIGAAFMMGFLASPWGWVALSLVGAGTLVGIGTFVVRLRQSTDKEKEETEGVVKDLIKLLRKDFDFETIFKGKEQEDIETVIQNKLKTYIQNNLDKALSGVIMAEKKEEFISEERSEMVLNSQTWPKNPTLLQLVAQSIYKEVNPS